MSCGYSETEEETSENVLESSEQGDTENIKEPFSNNEASSQDSDTSNTSLNSSPEFLDFAVAIAGKLVELTDKRRASGNNYTRSVKQELIQTLNKNCDISSQKENVAAVPTEHELTDTEKERSQPSYFDSESEPPCADSNNNILNSDFGERGDKELKNTKNTKNDLLSAENDDSVFKLKFQKSPFLKSSMKKSNFFADCVFKKPELKTCDENVPRILQNKQNVRFLSPLFAKKDNGYYEERHSLFSKMNECFSKRDGSAVSSCAKSNVKDFRNNSKRNNLSSLFEKAKEENRKLSSLNPLEFIRETLEKDDERKVLFSPKTKSCVGQAFVETKNIRRRRENYDIRDLTRSRNADLKCDAREIPDFESIVKMDASGNMNMTQVKTPLLTYYPRKMF